MVLMDAISSIIAAYIGYKLDMDWCLCSGANNVKLIVYGFKNIEAQIGSIILPVEIIFATIFSFLVFKEVPTTLTILGGFLIIFAAIIPSLTVLKQKSGQKNF